MGVVGCWGGGDGGRDSVGVGGNSSECGGYGGRDGVVGHGRTLLGWVESPGLWLLK